MNAALIVQALRREREDLAARWLGQFTVNRATSDRPLLTVDGEIVDALFDDVVAMLESADLDANAPATHKESLEHLAEFPDTIAVVIDLLQAGVQVLGAFAVENAGPFAAWSVRERNIFLGELDAVFPVLVRREIEALCAGFEPAAPAKSAGASIELFPLPAISRAAARRN